MDQVIEIADRLVIQFAIECPQQRDALIQVIKADIAASTLEDLDRIVALRNLYGYQDEQLSACADQYLIYRDYYWGL